MFDGPNTIERKADEQLINSDRTATSKMVLVRLRESLRSEIKLYFIMLGRI